MRRIAAILLVLVMALCAMPALGDGYNSYGGEMAAASTSLDGASDANIENITLAAAALDGLYIPYGDYFSFNDAVGPRTEDFGFVRAKNGRGSKVYGGGVAQVATTLYLALLDLSGITYDDISTYGERFTGDYVSDGELAIVTDYSRGTDFAFWNYEDDMVLNVWLEDDELYCTITGDSYYNGGADDGMELIASYSFSIDGSEGLISNITRAAESIDGTVLEHGDTFSFNDVVGPRTRRNGYVKAVNGRGSKVTGGGVAQVASVIWLTIDGMDDITIVEKSTYGKRYNQDYVDSASDAIVTDYNAGTDFSFRNMRGETIVIETYVDGDVLSCDIYSAEYESYVEPIDVTPVLSW